MKTREYIVIMTSFASVLLLSQHVFAESEKEKLPHPELYKLHLIKKKLKCGDAELVTDSACFFSNDTPDQQCKKQSIRLVNSKKGISKKLPLDGKSVKKNFKESPGPVLDAVVDYAVCVNSTSGIPYIFLYYSCRWGRNCTPQTGVWQRFFTTDGINLTVGKPENVPYDRISEKYGLPETGKGGSRINLTLTSDE